MENRIAFCGLNCEECDAYIATANDDQKLREKTAKLWSELNQTVILPEQISCEGCRNDGIKTFFCGNICAIRKCALEKNVKTCADCTGYESCKILETITANNPGALDNLKKRAEQENT